MPSLNLYGIDFYSGREIPEFSSSENKLLEDFGIRFLRIKKVSQFEKHNKGLVHLIDKYGSKWKDSLIILTSSFDEDKTNFIKYLFSSQALDQLNKNKNNVNISHSMSYHTNGIIAVYMIKSALKKNGGGMYHYLVVTKNWDKKGHKIKGTKEEFYGSAC